MCLPDSVSKLLDINFKDIGSIEYIGDPEVNMDVDVVVQIKKIN